MWYINGRVESLPLTNMRYINGWVESLVLRRKAGDFFYNGDKYMKKHCPVVSTNIDESWRERKKQENLAIFFTS